jgi:hypothetical protein
VLVSEAIRPIIAATVVLIVVLAQVMVAPALLPYTAAVTLALALLLELREKRSNVALEPAAGHQGSRLRS